MTLQETERCRRQSARDKAMHYERRRSGGGDDAIRPDDNRVLTLAQWCALNGISLAYWPQADQRRHRSGHHDSARGASALRSGTTDHGKRRERALRERWCSEKATGATLALMAAPGGPMIDLETTIVRSISPTRHKRKSRP